MCERPIKILLAKSGFRIWGPNTFEINEVGHHGNLRHGLPQALRRAAQFGRMMARLGLRIAAECLQSAVGSAVGMHHEHHAIRAVQTDGLAD